ncbi:hypothetical protein Bbelb_364510 [Branchiostoma belcheri]|nr:hypothetical protein Bbelb_364510 [Branchiostoma belcheri]
MAGPSEETDVLLQPTSPTPSETATPAAGLKSRKTNLAPQYPTLLKFHEKGMTNNKEPEAKEMIEEVLKQTKLDKDIVLCGACDVGIVVTCITQCGACDVDILCLV